MKNRKIMKKCSAFLVAAAMVFTNIVPVYAAEGSYKISFKAGAKGIFADGETNHTVYREYEADISNDVAAATNQIQKSIENSGYYFTGWSPEISEKVERRATYVAQYARIIDEAVYSINYVDTYGNAVATQKVISADLNAAVTAYAETVEGYTVDAVSKSATIDKKNGTEITFVYTIVPNRVTETETVVIPPEPAPETPQPETPASPAPAQTPEAQQPGTVTVEDEEVPLADGTLDEDGNAQELQDIEDEEVPLANENLSENEDAQELQDIEDEEVPLANNDISSNSKWLYAGPAIALALAAAVGILVYMKRRQKESKE